MGWAKAGAASRATPKDGDTVKTQAAVSGKTGTFTVKYYVSDSSDEGSFVTDIDNTFSATKE
jgi:hypothetical protein